jgi:hypothetical protein
MRHDQQRRAARPGAPATRAQSSRSVSTSSAEERSSQTSSAGARSNMRAAAARCTCPPESRTPRGPTSVSTPCLQRRHIRRRAPRRWSASARSHAAFRQPEQDILAQRRAEEARRLRRVGAARRLKPGRRVGHELPIPVNFAGIVRQQTEQRAQQRRLAGADLPGDDGERPAGSAAATMSRTPRPLAGKMAVSPRTSITTSRSAAWRRGGAASGGGAGLVDGVVFGQRLWRRFRGSTL